MVSGVLMDVESAQQEPRSVPSETDLAWAAGFIDADGCVSVQRSPAVSQTFRGGYYYSLSVQGINTHLGALERLQGMFGGAVRARKQGGSPHSAITHDWRILNRAAGEVLELLIPYLIIKRERAELALVFLRDYQISLARGRHRRKTEYQFKRGAEIWEQMKTLNTGGRFHIGAGHRITPLRAF